MEEKLRFAVVGMGHIGRRHAAVIGEMAEAELVGVCDVKSNLELGIGNLGVPFFNSIELLLAADLSIDVVCIATPNGLHAPQGLLALAAGKHVVVEKPMALTTADCEALIAKAKEKGRTIFPVMQNRYSPPAVWLKELVPGNVLGNIFMVQVNCFWNRDERYYQPGGWRGTAEMDGGTLFTQFSHFIDLVLWLFGDMQNLAADFRNFNHGGMIDFEDSGCISFDLTGGGRGSFNYSTAVWDTNFESSILIIAEHGTVKLGGQYMDQVLHCHIKDYSMPSLGATAPSNDYGMYKGSAANHQHVFENVVAVLNRSEEIHTTAADASRVTATINQVYQLKTADVGRH